MAQTFSLPLTWYMPMWVDLLLLHTRSTTINRLQFWKAQDQHGLVGALHLCPWHLGVSFRTIFDRVKGFPTSGIEHTIVSILKNGDLLIPRAQSYTYLGLRFIGRWLSLWAAVCAWLSHGYTFLTVERQWAHIEFQESWTKQWWFYTIVTPTLCLGWILGNQAYSAQNWRDAERRVVFMISHTITSTVSVLHNITWSKMRAARIVMEALLHIETYM